MDVLTDRFSCLAERHVGQVGDAYAEEESDGDDGGGGRG